MNSFYRNSQLSGNMSFPTMLNSLYLTA
uniref:Uncharacterized protein n=1 Tax=Arundo donax TaxID=35708 RepID=A0A0A8YGW5_ARUDO